MMKSMLRILITLLPIFTMSTALATQWYVIQNETTFWEDISGKKPHPMCIESHGPVAEIEDIQSLGLQYKATDIVENGIVVETTISEIGNCTADELRRWKQSGKVLPPVGISCFRDSEYGPYYRKDRCESVVRTLNPDPENLSRYD